MTALAERELEAPKTTSRLSPLNVFWIIVTVALIVCHGCHPGDHDDELGVSEDQTESAATEE